MLDDGPAGAAAALCWGEAQAVPCWRGTCLLLQAASRGCDVCTGQAVGRGRRAESSAAPGPDNSSFSSLDKPAAAPLRVTCSCLCR